MYSPFTYLFIDSNKDINFLLISTVIIAFLKIFSEFNYSEFNFKLKLPKAALI